MDADKNSMEKKTSEIEEIVVSVRQVKSLTAQNNGRFIELLFNKTDLFQLTPEQARPLAQCLKMLCGPPPKLGSGAHKKQKQRKKKVKK